MVLPPAGVSAKKVLLVHVPQSANSSTTTMDCDTDKVDASACNPRSVLATGAACVVVDANADALYVPDRPNDEEDRGAEAPDRGDAERESNLEGVDAPLRRFPDCRGADDEFILGEDSFCSA